MGTHASSATVPAVCTSGIELLRCRQHAGTTCQGRLMMHWPVRLYNQHLRQVKVW